MNRCPIHGSHTDDCPQCEANTKLRESRSCPICTEPESLCRCDETPALKLARKLVSEADGTYSQTVTIKHGDFITLCERAYAWANDQSAAILGERAARSEKKRKLTDEEIQHWAERHDLGPGMTDLRACIEDARSL